jgi:ribosomal protein S18 acetylase RimI-like enzyme
VDVLPATGEDAMPQCFGVSNLRIESLTSASQIQACARIMANSEPWITLKRSYEDSVAILSDPAREVHVALIDDEIVGFTILQKEGAFAGYLQTVAIVPKCRGQGLGTRLIQFAEERLLSEFPNVFLCVSSFNLGAQRLYRRLGYRTIGELTDFIVRGHSEILMRKTIAPLTEFTPDR